MDESASSESKTTSSNYFSNDLKEVISYSREEALRLGNEFIETDHLFLGILKERNNSAMKILQSFPITLTSVKYEIEKDIKSKNKKNETILSIPLTKQAEKSIRISVLEARALGIKTTNTACLLLAILKIPEAKVNKILSKYGILYEIFLDKVKEYLKFMSLEGNTRVDGFAELDEEEDTIDYNSQVIEPNEEIKILLERVIQVCIKDSIDGVLDIEKESAEIASLLIRLSYDQGMMFGLFGRWGRGKTFFWKNIWKNLSEKQSNPFIKVEFHAWKYQDTPATWAYLYETLAKEFYKKPSGFNFFVWIAYYWRIILLNIKRKGIIPVLTFLLLVSFGFIGFYLTIYLADQNPKGVNAIATYLGIPVSTLLIIYGLLKNLKKEFSTKARDLFIKYTQRYSLKEHLGIQAEIQKEIITLLKTWIPNKLVGKKRILIFIDDIDRCNETKIIQIIDSLRIMLDELEIATRTVVLTAIDERVLEIAISNKYYDLVEKDFEEKKDKRINLKTLVREYMDKLFIGGIKLKTLNKYERNEVLKSLVKGKVNFPNSENNKLENEESRNRAKRTKSTHSEQEDIVFGKYYDLFVNSQAEKNDENFELEGFELNFLQEVLEVTEDITPRTIRIFYYRYLLAKRFMYQKLLKNSSLFIKWNRKTDKSILPFLIMYFSLDSTPQQINQYYENWVNANQKDIKETETSEIMVLTKVFHIDKELFKEILQIIEVIVPY